MIEMIKIISFLYIKIIDIDILLTRPRISG